MIRETDPTITFAIARHLSRYDLIGNALNFDGAIMMLRGNKDLLINRALKKTLPAMQGKELFFLKDVNGAGHCANLDQPEIVREAILDFVGGGWIFFD